MEKLGVCAEKAVLAKRAKNDCSVLTPASSGWTPGAEESSAAIDRVLARCSRRRSARADSWPKYCTMPRLLPSHFHGWPRAEIVSRLFHPRARAGAGRSGIAWLAAGGPYSLYESRLFRTLRPPTPLTTPPLAASTQPAVVWLASTALRARPAVAVPAPRTAGRATS